MARWNKVNYTQQLGPPCYRYCCITVCTPKERLTLITLLKHRGFMKELIRTAQNTHATVGAAALPDRNTHVTERVRVTYPSFGEITLMAPTPREPASGGAWFCLLSVVPDVFLSCAGEYVFPWVKIGFVPAIYY